MMTGMIQLTVTDNTGRQIVRQTGRQTNRQIHRHTLRGTYGPMVASLPGTE